MVPSLSKKKQGIKETSPSPPLKRHGCRSTKGNRSKVSRCSSRVGVSSKGGARKAKRHTKNSVDEEVSEGSDGTSAKKRLRRSPHVARGSPHVAKAKKQPENLRKCKRNDSADEDSDTSKEYSEYSLESDCTSSNVVPVHLPPIPYCSKVAFMFVVPKKSRMR
jgi:hypothetical protein